MNAKKIMAVLIISIVLAMPVSTVSALRIIPEPPKVTIGKDSASVSFATDSDAQIAIEYGDNNNRKAEKNEEQSFSTLHSFSLFSLQPNKQYFYRVLAKTQQNPNIIPFPAGTYYVFKTLDSIEPHKIQGLAAKNIGVSSAMLSWPASADTDTVNYRVYRDNELVAEPAKTEYLDSALQAATTYVYQVSSIDTANTESLRSDALAVKTLERDTIAPVIADLKLIGISSSSATFTWKTDEKSNTSIQYGLSSGQLTMSAGTNDFVEGHTATASSLSDGVIYYYRAASCDKEKNCASSEEKSFMAGEDVIPPAVEASLPEYHNDVRLDISGSTEPLAFIYVYVNDKAVPSAFTATKEDGIFSVRATGMVPGQANKVRIEAKDRANNVGAKEFSVFVDIKNPDVKLSDIPELTSQQPFNVSGTVDEEVNITYGVARSKEDIPRQQTISASGEFSFQLELAEGSNFISITANDRAGNMFSMEKEITLDTTPPVILDTNLGQLTPAYSAAVKVRGKVDTPGALVTITVNNRTSGAGALPTSLSGIFTHFSNLGDRYLAYADENGAFSIDVELERFGYTPSTASGLDTSQLRPGEIGGRSQAAAGSQARDFTRDSFTANNIIITAYDQVGLASEPEQDVIEYRSCGQGGAWQVTIKDLTPNIIPSEHLLRGYAQFGFNIHLEYQGGYDKDKSFVREVTLEQFELSRDEQDGKYKHSKLLNRPSVYISDDSQDVHAYYKLKKWAGTEKELRDVTMLNFPVLLEVDYTETDFEGNQIPGLQKQCVDPLSIQVEQRLDIEGHIPEKFLENSIDAIDKAVKAMEQLREPLNRLQVILLVSCVGSWIALWVKNLAQELTCLGVRKDAVAQWRSEEGFGGNGGCSSNKNPSDCTSCLESMKSTRKTETGIRYLCSRVFCPDVPSIPQHTATYRDPILGTSKQKNACVERPPNVPEQQSGPTFGDETPSPTPGIATAPLAKEVEEDKCKKEYERLYSSACLMEDEWATAKRAEGESTDFFHNVVDSISGMCEPDRVPEDRIVTQTTYGPGGKSNVNEYIIEDGKFYTVETKTESVSQDGGEATATVTKGSQLTPKYDTKGKMTDQYLYVADPETGQAIGENTNIKVKGLEQYFKAPPKYVIKPSGSLFKSVQCVCIPALLGYIDFWKQVLTLVRRCFQSILITKKADSGLCKAVLTRYICDLFYDAIRCLSQKYSVGAGADVGESATEGINGFMGAASRASSQMQAFIQESYGTTNLYKAMFSERKLIHSICIGAFTGDWDLDLEGLLNGAGRIPIASEAWILVATRRFMGADPTREGLTTNMYHVGAGIVAGAPLDWRMELVCSNDNSCPESGNPGSACDCALGNSPKEFMQVLERGHLESGESFGFGNEEGDQYRPITEKVRFDKVRLFYSYKDNSGQNVQEKVERKINIIGSPPPVECFFDISLLSYHCKFAIGKSGLARFVEPPKPERQLYGVNDTVNMEYQIIKQSPNVVLDAEDEEDRNLDSQVPKWIAYKLFNHNKVSIPLINSAANSEVRKILDTDGTYTNREIKATERFFKQLKIPDYIIKKEDFERSSAVIRPQIVHLDKSNKLEVLDPVTTQTKKSAVKVEVTEVRDDKATCSMTEGTYKAEPYQLKVGDVIVRRETNDVRYEVLDTTNNLVKTKNVKTNEIKTFPNRNDILGIDPVAVFVSVEEKISENTYKSLTIEQVQGTIGTFDPLVEPAKVKNGIKCSIHDNIQYDFEDKLFVKAKIKEQPKQGSSLVFVIDDAKRPVSECERFTAANPARWKLEVELHDALPKEQDEELSIRNYDTNEIGRISLHRGEQQKYSVEFDVSCSTKEDRKNACETDRKLSQICRCYGTEDLKKDENFNEKQVNCGDSMRGLYCVKKEAAGQTAAITPATSPAKLECKKEVPEEIKLITKGDVDADNAELDVRVLGAGIESVDDLLKKFTITVEEAS